MKTSTTLVKIIVAMIVGYVLAAASGIMGIIAFIDIFTTAEVFSHPILMTFLGILGAPILFFSTLYLGYRAQRRRVQKERAANPLVTNGLGLQLRQPRFGKWNI